MEGGPVGQEVGRYESGSMAGTARLAAWEPGDPPLLDMVVTLVEEVADRYGKIRE